MGSYRLNVSTSRALDPHAHSLTCLNSALFIGVFLNIVTSIKRVHTAILSDIPRSLRPYIPLIPSPIAIIYIVAREWQISAVAATRARLEGLRVAVASSHSVSSEEISWLDSKKWEGVDFSRIGL